MSVLLLVRMLDERFGSPVDLSQLALGNFETVRAMKNLIRCAPGDGEASSCSLDRSKGDTC